MDSEPVFYTQRNDFKAKYTLSLFKTIKTVQRIVQGKLSLSFFLDQSFTENQWLSARSDNQVRINENFVPKVMVNNTEFKLTEFLKQIIEIPTYKLYDYQPSTVALQTLLQLAIHLVANGAIVPQVLQLPSKLFVIRWLPALLSKPVKQLVDQLDDILPPDIFVWVDKSKEKVVSKDRTLNLLSLVISELVCAANSQTETDLFLRMFFQNTPYAFTQPGEEALVGGMMIWVQKYFLTQGHWQPQLVIEEGEMDDFKISISVQDNQAKLATSIPLREVLVNTDYATDRFEILQSFIQLSPFIQGLDGYINSNGADEIRMSTQVFTPFLMQMIPAIQLLDISVMLPKSLQEILKPKATVKIKKSPSGKSFINLGQLFEFEWKVAIGNSVMNESEFKALMRVSNGLMKYKNQYIYVDSDELTKIHKHFTQTKELSSFQMLRTALSGEYMGAKIELTKEIETLIHELTNTQDIALPKEINAQLRPYQLRGYSWMYRNAQIGFGSVLADDMGLGKTLQVITTILKFKEDGVLETHKALVVAPTGLLSNWEAEIEKFAPSLQSIIYHGANRSLSNLPPFDVMITSYGIARSDTDLLKKMKWHSLVIDEAQNIKNTNTFQTKAIKAIKSNNFIAMSGTPVENRLSELWSIMDYSNRGYLGSLKEFATDYASPIEDLNDTAVAEKLKRITAPFVMRRMKTDKTIISDLPDKIEIDAFATLTKEQAVLYETTLGEAMAAIEASSEEGHNALFIRQGLVLQMILVLKQICNHPTQFLKNKKMDASLSGKVELLFSKLDSIIESQEKVLIFTQFTEMGELLKHFITERYQEEPLFYHGACSITQRKDMVQRFQNNHSDKIFILSIKAAGTGLNLTAANHVIHYDLWWNPAVENQATDRAYRIGQKKNVMVHRFITKNTFEERINEMIQEKKKLADMTVATGENWIGKLSNKELRDLFQ